MLTALLLGVLAPAMTVPAAQAAVDVASPTVVETNDTGVVASFTVTRTAGLLSGSATIAFSTADGSARAPEDYAAASGALFFGSLPLGGVQTQQVKVAIKGDPLDEPHETFRLLLSGSAEIAGGEGVATIVDDDPPPVVDDDEPVVPAPTAPSPGAEAAAPAVGEPAGAAAPYAGVPADSAARPTSSAPALGLSSPRLQRPATVLVTVSCPRQATGCRGRVTIFSRANPRSKIKALRRERRLGRRSFTLPAGRTRTLTIALSRSDRVLLKRTGRMLVRAYALTTDASGRSAVRRVTGTLIARTSHS